MEVGGVGRVKEDGGLLAFARSLRNTETPYQRPVYGVPPSPSLEPHGGAGRKTPTQTNSKTARSARTPHQHSSPPEQLQHYCYLPPLSATRNHSSLSPSLYLYLCLSPSPVCTSTLLYLLYSTLLYSTLLYSTLLYSTLLYSTIYSTLLYSTLYSTLLYSTLLTQSLLFLLLHPPPINPTLIH